MQSVTGYYRVLQSITEYYRVLQSVTECYRVLPSVSEFYRFLQNITEYFRVLQSIRECCRVSQIISSASTWTNFWACYCRNHIDCRSLSGLQWITFADSNTMLWGLTRRAVTLFTSRGAGTPSAETFDRVLCHRAVQSQHRLGLKCTSR